MNPGAPGAPVTPVTPVTLDVTVALVTLVKGLAVAPHLARQCDISVSCLQRS
jgi:hypothetical protein